MNDPRPLSALDPYAHAAAIVRERDPDRYVADLFAPAAARPHVLALHAFNAEVSLVRDLVSDPTLGEIRLRWWHDTISAGAGGGHPVAAALIDTIQRFSLPRQALANLIAARVFDLYDDAMPSLNDLEGYAGETSSSLIHLAAIILAGGRDPGSAEAAGHAGVAYAITGLMRALARTTARGQCFLPGDMMTVRGLTRAAIVARRATQEIRSLLRDLRTITRQHLAEAERALVELDPAVLPAFLPLALIRPYLARMDRADYEPFAETVELPRWRRQWILWRTARRM
jgi:phytoene synthase